MRAFFSRRVLAPPESHHAQVFANLGFAFHLLGGCREKSHSTFATNQNGMMFGCAWLVVHAQRLNVHHHQA